MESVEEILDRLGGPTAKPCAECPWRRDSVPGHLGPATAQEWVDIAHGESPIACHMTVTSSDQDWSEVRQCAGAAIFRTNVCKVPRHPKVAVLPSDTKTVFGRNDQFIAHHTKEQQP